MSIPSNLLCPFIRDSGQVAVTFDMSDRPYGKRIRKPLSASAHSLSDAVGKFVGISGLERCDLVAKPPDAENNLVL